MGVLRPAIRPRPYVPPLNVRQIVDEVITVKMLPGRRSAGGEEPRRPIEAVLWCVAGVGTAL